MTIWALAPMDGITGCAMRSVALDLFKKYQTDQSKELWMFTEFMSSEGYLRNPQRLSKHLLTSSDQFGSNLVAQIYGGDVDNLLHAAVEIDTKYDFFTGIELNIGCPSPKVMACEAGSGMLRNRQKTVDIVKKLATSIKKPFSIKTRAGLTSDDKEEQFQFIAEVSQYCHMITIHGRTYKQSHSGEVDREYIYRVKQHLLNQGSATKVIGNGGLNSYLDGEARVGNLDGVMFGQAAMMNPWVLTGISPTIEQTYDYILAFLDYFVACDLYFFGESSRDIEKSILNMPTQDELYQIISDFKRSYTGEEMHSVVEFRKHLFRALTGLPGNKEFKQKVATIKQYDRLINEINLYFLPLLQGNHLG